MKDWLLVMILGAIPFSIGLVWLIVISMTIPQALCLIGGILCMIGIVGWLCSGDYDFPA